MSAEDIAARMLGGLPEKKRIVSDPVPVSGNQCRVEGEYRDECTFSTNHEGDHSWQK